MALQEQDFSEIIAKSGVWSLKSSEPIGGGSIDRLVINEEEEIKELRSGENSD